MKDMIRKYILVSVFMMAVSMAIGQYDFSINGKSILDLQNESSAPLKITRPIFHAMPLLEDDPQRVDFPGLEQQLLAPYNIDEIPFFCRLEVKIEKRLRVPFKFRLGEVHYTESMEGKY